MQESRRRDLISATPARWRRKLFASPRSLPDQGAARKRTNALPEIFSLILCEGALASANSSPRPEMQDHCPGRSKWFCQIRRGTSQILPAYWPSLSEQTVSSGSDRKDRELTPEQTCPWCSRLQAEAECHRCGAASRSRSRGIFPGSSTPHFW